MEVIWHLVTESFQQQVHRSFVLSFHWKFMWPGHWQQPEIHEQIDVLYNVNAF